MTRELRQVLAQLELCSQISAVNLNGTGRDAGEDIGGKRPSGGVNRKDDREATFPQKSAEHFRRELARGRPETLVLEHAEASLAAWKRQPTPSEPDYGTPLWKRWVAESPESDINLARKFYVSRQYIHRVRTQYAA